MPLFVSRRRLETRVTLPRARGPWALDSGGFTELSLHGRWTITVDDYVAQVRRYAGEIGKLLWAAPMDSMCEPWIRAKTGRSVAEHQRLTTENYLALRAKAPDLPFIPVLQGWTLADYLRHAAQYEQKGIALAAEPLVGVGSVCRRQGSAGAAVILRTLAALGLRLHAFGLKTRGLRLAADSVVSADSLVWSYGARRGPPLPACRGTHAHCNNCLRYALRWRERLLRSVDVELPSHGVQAPQPRLFPELDSLPSPPRLRFGPPVHPTPEAAAVASASGHRPDALTARPGRAPACVPVGGAPL